MPLRVGTGVKVITDVVYRDGRIVNKTGGNTVIGTIARIVWPPDLEVQLARATKPEWWDDMYAPQGDQAIQEWAQRGQTAKEWTPHDAVEGCRYVVLRKEDLVEEVVAVDRIIGVWSTGV